MTFTYFFFFMLLLLDVRFVICDARDACFRGVVTSFCHAFHLWYDCLCDVYIYLPTCVCVRIYIIILNKRYVKYAKVMLLTGSTYLVQNDQARL